GPAERGAQDPEHACDSERDERCEHERVGESAVSQSVLVRNAEAECQHVEVGKDASDHARLDEPPRHDFTSQAESEGERNGRMRNNGRHQQRVTLPRSSFILQLNLAPDSLTTLAARASSFDMWLANPSGVL